MAEWIIGGTVKYTPRYLERFITAETLEEAEDLFVDSIFEDEEFVDEVDVSFGKALEEADE